MLPGSGLLEEELYDYMIGIEIFRRRRRPIESVFVYHIYAGVLWLRLVYLLESS